MGRFMPTVTDGTLCYQEQGHEQTMPVGTPDWYAWLQTARTFTFRTSSCQFTVRKERAGNRRGNWYWKAYWRREGKLCSAYLGQTELLLAERLAAVATWLSGASPGKNQQPEVEAKPAPERQGVARQEPAHLHDRMQFSPLPTALTPSLGASRIPAAS